MNAAGRKEHWEGIYRDKSPLNVTWYQQKPVLSLQLIHATQISRHEPIIDVGGGTSALVDCLCEEGFSRVTVLDISSRALEFARKRLGTKALGVEWYAEDVTRFQPPHGYWLWHDRAVFHFLTDAEDRRQYVKVLKQALQPGGHLIIATFADGGPAKCSGLDIVQYNAVRLMTELGEGFSMVEQTSEVHITPAKNEQKFNWFRLLRKPDTGLPISWTS